MKYHIFTEINGVKNYVRRINVGKYSTRVTMYTATVDKAYDFLTAEKASHQLNRMGIGKAIEVRK